MVLQLSRFINDHMFQNTLGTATSNQYPISKIRNHKCWLKPIKFNLFFIGNIENHKSWYKQRSLSFYCMGSSYTFGVDIHIREECRVYFWCCRSRYAVQLFLIMFALRIFIRWIHGHPLIGQQPKINMVTWWYKKLPSNLWLHWTCEVSIHNVQVANEGQFMITYMNNA